MTIMNASVDYGTDWSTFALNPRGESDLDPNFKLISGPRVVLERVARRLLTKPGLLDDDPNFGIDLTESVNSDIEPADLAEIIRGEVCKDDAVTSATVSSTSSSGRLSIRITLTLVDGVVPMVLTFDGLTYSAVFGG